MAKNTKLTEKNAVELKALLAEKREELRATRFASAGARAKDTNAHSRLRKDIARINTELRARESAAADALENQRENA